MENKYKAIIKKTAQTVCAAERCWDQTFRWPIITRPLLTWFQDVNPQSSRTETDVEMEEMLIVLLLSCHINMFSMDTLTPICLPKYNHWLFRSGRNSPILKSRERRTRFDWTLELVPWAHRSADAHTVSFSSNSLEIGRTRRTFCWANDLGRLFAQRIALVCGRHKACHSSF